MGTDKAGFSDDSEVNVHQNLEQDDPEKDDWVTLSPLEYFTGSELLRVEVGQHTDFASVPRLFVWLMPKYGLYTRSAILHDHLCRSEEVPRRKADRIFRQAMRTEDVAFLRRWLMWGAVRIGALKTARDRRQWLGTGLQVLLLAVIALPVIGPPAVTIVVGLALFYVFEMITAGILAVAGLVRRIGGKPAKPVNTPKLSFKL
jgi:hypothetical protein